MVELLVVMAVIVVIIALSAPAITGMRNAGDVSKTVYDIAGLLEQSRAYAMTNNTYVYVGFGEADANSSPSGKQTFSDTTIGRVSVAVVATRDGSRGYDSNGGTKTSDSWNSSYKNGKNLLTIGKVQSFSNIHLVDLGKRPANGTMARPPYNNTDAVEARYNLGTSGCVSATPVTYPPGSDSSDPSKTSYPFTKVIQFDPQGTATIPRDDNTDSVPKVIEIGLQQSRGNAAPALTSPVTGNVAAIQIDGMLGSTRIYRP